MPPACCNVTSPTSSGGSMPFLLSRTMARICQLVQYTKSPDAVKPTGNKLNKSGFSWSSTRLLLPSRSDASMELRKLSAQYICLSVKKNRPFNVNCALVKCSCIYGMMLWLSLALKLIIIELYPIHLTAVS